MRIDPRALVATLAVVAGGAIAVAQAPNFSSLTASITVLLAGTPNAHTVTVPLPYHEPDRRLLAPVPADQFDQTWPLAVQEPDMSADHPMEG
jgi:hypothetical protein